MLDDQYEVILADTKESIHLHYKLRYQVYCLEKGFEEAKNFPKGEEYDQYDPRSVHFLVREKRTSKWIAALRLILPGKQALPIENLGVIDKEIRNSECMATSAEISRVCRIKNDALFSNQKNINATPETKKVCNENLLIMLSIIRAAIFYGKANGISHIFFLGRPALARLVSRLYIPFQKAGEGCDYKGMRHPYLVTLENIVASISERSPDLAKLMTAESAYRLYSEFDHYKQPLPLAS
jgi:N-acyl amino acid synthase of PEP-CTERM/exosortase system